MITNINKVIKESYLYWILGFICIPFSVLSKDIPPLCFGFLILGSWFTLYPAINRWRKRTSLLVLTTKLNHGD